MPGPFAIADRSYHCPVELTLSAIGGKWKVLILWRLMDGTMRYSELRRSLGAITHKMLAQQLRELEADGLIVRTVHPVIPPHVDYALTDAGRRLGPVIRAMAKWGGVYAARQGETAAAG